MLEKEYPRDREGAGVSRSAPFRRNAARLFLMLLDGECREEGEEGSRKARQKKFGEETATANADTSRSGNDSALFDAPAAGGRRSMRLRRKEEGSGVGAGASSSRPSSFCELPPSSRGLLLLLLLRPLLLLHRRMWR